MVKKELGYVELEWACPSCGARNKGSDHDCRQCGAEMPDDVHFELPSSAKLDTSTETAESVTAGPDILCPWCGARNPGTSEACSQCGGPLMDGKRRDSGDVVGAYQGSAATAPARPVGAAQPKSSRRAKPARPRPATGAGSPPQSKRFAWIVIGILAVMVAFALTMMSLSKGRDTLTATVVSVGWESTITTEELAPVQREGWRDQVPQGSRISNCTAKVRFTHDEPVADSVERCGTPYVLDTGTGQGKVQQDCFYDVYDSWCTYEAQEWRQARPVVLSGTGYSPSWPSIPARADVREVERNQVLFVQLSDGTKSYRYIPHSLSELAQFEQDSQWVITVNAFGGVTDIVPR